MHYSFLLMIENPFRRGTANREPIKEVVKRIGVWISGEDKLV